METVKTVKNHNRTTSSLSYSANIIARIQQEIDNYSIRDDVGDPGVQRSLLYLISQRDLLKTEQRSSAEFVAFWQSTLDRLPSLEGYRKPFYEKYQATEAPIDEIEAWIGDSLDVNDRNTQYAMTEFSAFRESVGFRFLLMTSIVDEFVNAVEAIETNAYDKDAHAGRLADLLGQPELLPEAVFKRFADICVSISEQDEEFDRSSVEKQLMNIVICSRAMSESELWTMDFHLLACILGIVQLADVDISKSDGMWVSDLVRVYTERKWEEASSEQFLWFRPDARSALIVRSEARRIEQEEVAKAIQTMETAKKSLSSDPVGAAAVIEKQKARSEIVEMMGSS